jgi:hypothetical protein
MATRKSKRSVKRRATRKPESTRVHVVRARLSVHELSKAGTSLFVEIMARGEKIGELEIGRGSLYWRGGKRQIRKRLRWPQFAELMDKLAYGDS